MIGRSLNFPCFSFWRFPEIYSTLKNVVEYIFVHIVQICLEFIELIHLVLKI